ncbi:transposase [Escherichia coli]|nr:transposase [Escherichia coli]
MLFGTRSEKLRREVELAEALLKQREQDSDRYSGREDDPQVPRQLRQSRHRRPLPAHLPRENTPPGARRKLLPGVWR